MMLYKTVAAVMADEYAQSLEASEVHSYIGRPERCRAVQHTLGCMG